MDGLVIKNTGSWYTVETHDGTIVDCKIKGNFRLKGIRSTNPIAVGDRVDFIVQEQDEVGLITAIHDRKNYIIRKSINLSKQSHIIAANVDQAFLVATIAHPVTSTTFIDRFLASAEAYRIPVVIIFNKVDLLDDEDKKLLRMMKALYENIGYECLSVSAISGEGIDAIRQKIAGRISVFNGHSGVGKSTILNHFLDSHQQKTAEISDAHDAGMHTTTFSEMFKFDDGGTYLIDTPGIKGFGTFDIEKEELTSYFKEIFEYSKDCRFSNCTHTHEPGCAVLKALNDHYIAQSRYNSYLSMLDDKEESRYREPQ